MATERIGRLYQLGVTRLSRVTTGGQHIRQIDGLRFIAIGTVFVQHVLHVLDEHGGGLRGSANALTVELVDRCHFGVELFFVISGFVLALPFARHRLLGGPPVSLRQYYWRRVTRLEPPYVVSMLLWFGVSVLYWHIPPGPLLPHLFASLFYLHNLIYGRFSTVSAVAWSLEIEVQFYLLAPLLGRVYSIREPAVRRAVILFGAVGLLQSYKLLYRHAPAVANLGGEGGTILNSAPLFLMGFLLADLYLTRWRRNPPVSYWVDLIALPGWALVPFYFLPAIYHRLPASLLPFILLAVVAASLRGRLTSRLLANSLLVTVGGMCYSIYLLHYPLIEILGVYSPIPLFARRLDLNLLAYTVLWGVPTLAVSIAFFIAIEKPCMRKDWPIRLVARLRDRPLSAASPGVTVSPEQTAPLPSNQPVP